MLDIYSNLYLLKKTSICEVLRSAKRQTEAIACIILTELISRFEADASETNANLLPPSSLRHRATCRNLWTADSSSERRSLIAGNLPSRQPLKRDQQATNILVSSDGNRVDEMLLPAPDYGKTPSQYPVCGAPAARTRLPDTKICPATWSRRRNTERSRRFLQFPWLQQQMIRRKPGFRSHLLPKLKIFF